MNESIRNVYVKFWFTLLIVLGSSFLETSGNSMEAKSLEQNLRRVLQQWKTCGFTILIPQELSWFANEFVSPIIDQLFKLPVSVQVRQQNLLNGTMRRILSKEHCFVFLSTAGNSNDSNLNIVTPFFEVLQRTREANYVNDKFMLFVKSPFAKYNYDCNDYALIPYNYLVIKINGGKQFGWTMLTGKHRDSRTMQNVELRYEDLQRFSEILRSHREQMNGEKVSVEIFFAVTNEKLDNWALRKMTPSFVRQSGRKRFIKLKFLSILSNKHNFTIVETRRNNRTKGSGKPCLSSFGLVGAIMGSKFRHEDLVFRFFLSYKIIYHTDVIKSDPIADLVRPFYFHTWVFLIGSSSLISLLATYSWKNWSFSEAVHRMLTLLFLQVSSTKIPGKIKYSAWMLCTFFISSIYVAKLKSSIVKPLILQESKSLENLLGGDFKIYCLVWKFLSFNITHHALRNNPLGNSQILQEQEQLLNSLRLVNGTEEVRAIISSTSHALVRESSSISYFAKLLSREFQQNYYSTSTSFFNSASCWHIKFPNNDIIARNMKILYSAGIQQFWENIAITMSSDLAMKYIPEFRKKIPSRFKGNRSPPASDDLTSILLQSSPLSLNDSIIQGLLLVFMILIGLSGLTFAGENYYFDLLALAKVGISKVFKIWSFYIGVWSIHWHSKFKRGHSKINSTKT
ncbi:unnamed protein product [Allacma fusca]|uniref:Uncharacterized protein n=1 Tax=Allacma fusca TaxID=39272 RepID=A0A8J2NK00_9HEXA|nr:unnamed protein product [Allacma fusca]